MTTAERVKATADYFNLDLSEYDRKRLELIWFQEPTVREVIRKKEVIVEVEKKVPEFPVPKNTSILRQNKSQMLTLLKKICKEYNFHYMKCFTVERTEKIVNARVKFAREMKLLNPKITSEQLAKFLRVESSTIRLYWHRSKANVDIPPIPYKPRKIHKQ